MQEFYFNVFASIMYKNIFFIYTACLATILAEVIHPLQPWSVKKINGEWKFAKHTHTLPFIKGINHVQNLLGECEEYDKECIKANLLKTKYNNNKTLASLAALADFRRWGFNGAGYNAPPEHMQALPFFAACFTLMNSTGGPNPWRSAANQVFFPDPWDIAASSMIEDKVKAKCRASQTYNNNLLGYLWSDFPGYDIKKMQARFGKDFVTSLRLLPLKAPGRLVYTAYLEQKYKSIDVLCKAYELHTSQCLNSSWDTLDLAGRLNARNVNIPKMMEDDYGFLPSIVDQLYSRLYNATKSCDSHALIFGDTLVQDWAPLELILPVAAKYLDGISIQPSGGTVGSGDGPSRGGTWNQTYWNELRGLILKIKDMPVIIADNGFSFPHEPYKLFEWYEYASQQAAGAAYRSWVSEASKTSYILAMNKCQYIDRAVEQPQLGLKSGFITFNGTEHRTFVDLVTQANMEIP
eukprot:m.45214 g.45214  ORF g.45214 m.45214 type:complete len:465 (+) comp10212_c0_seq1:285-1679(+)